MRCIVYLKAEKEIRSKNNFYFKEFGAPKRAPYFYGIKTQYYV